MNLPEWTKLYRVSQKDLLWDWKTYRTLEKPSKEIIWEKEYPINRREWYWDVALEGFKVYELEVTSNFKKSYWNIPFLEWTVASQSPRMQMPWWKTQIFFEYKKIPSEFVTKIYVDWFVN